MTFAARHWIIALILAVAGHAALFAGSRLDDSAKLERAAGVNITLGSLQTLSQQTQADSADTIAASDPDATVAETPDEAEKADTTETVSKDKVAKDAPEPPKDIVAEKQSDQTPDKVSAVKPNTVKVTPPTPDSVPVVAATKTSTSKQKKVASLSATQPKTIKPDSDKTKAVAATELRKAAKKKPRAKKQAKKKKPKRASKRKAKRNNSKARKNRKRGGSRTASSRKGGGGGGNQNSVSGRVKLSNYKGRVRARIAGRVSRASGKRGRVIVRFTITGGGGVAGARVVSSTNSGLNRVALAAVRGGFPAIPPGLPRRMTFTVPIRFR